MGELINFHIFPIIHINIIYIVHILIIIFIVGIGVGPHWVGDLELGLEMGREWDLGLG